MNWMTTPYLNDLQRFLDLAGLRQSLIASNIANVDTPRYHTLDFNFQDALAEAEATPAGEAFTPDVQEVAGLMQRPDGNNVSVDREAMALAQTQLQYRVGISLLTSELHRIQSAINSGNGGMP
ncbi:MAG TPA: flagellar basal body protein [Terriglobales bacterium]|nr:flagellar basal body protein [Terriglobales bacterium]